MTPRRIITIKIETVTPDGAGLGYYTDRTIQANNKPVKVWGAFTGEVIETEIYKRQGGYWIGVLHKIIETPLKRLEPKDSTYFSSSPWQGISLHDELRFKLGIAQKVFEEIPEVNEKLLKLRPEEIVHDQHIYEYRNKMEYHMYEDDGEYGEAGKILVSIFGRKEKKRVPMNTNSLAVPGLHDFTLLFIKDISGIVGVGRSLKTLIVRSVDQLKAALFVKDVEIAEKIAKVITSPLSEKEIKFSSTYKDILTIYYSNPDSPASVVDKTMYVPHNESLSATLADTRLEFGLMSFFQINIPLADKLLKDIAGDVKNLLQLLPKSIKDTINILDYYSGVGTIGLAIMNILRTTQDTVDFKKIHLIQVEENKEASAYAVKNTKSLGLDSQTEIYCGDSANFIEHIAKADIVIVDPPRGGLHPKFVRQLLVDNPEFVIYQSCNIESMARDLRHLRALYSIEHVALYNFFPRTPHLEAYMILKKKDITNE